MKKIKSPYLHITVFLAISVLVVWAGFGFGPDLYLSPDAFFHLGRFRYLFENVQKLNFFNDFYSENYLLEMGYPLGIFYPQGTMYPFVILSLLLGLSMQQGFQLMMILIIFLTLVSFYYAFQKLYKKESLNHNPTLLAFMGSTLYVLIPTLIPVDVSSFKFSSYFFVNFYNRMSFGETIAFIFFPWVIVGLKELLFDKTKGNVLLFSLLGILYTHILSGLFVGIIVIVTLLCNFRVISKDRVLQISLLRVFSLFILIGSYQIFPMIEMMAFQDYGYNVPFFSKGTLFSMANLAGDIIITPVFIFVQIITGVSLIVLYFRVKKIQHKYLIFALIGIYCASKLFPWQLFESTPLTMIQFPFRLSFMYSLFAAFSLPAIIKFDVDWKYALMSFMTFILLVSINILPVPSIREWNGLSTTAVENVHPHTFFIGGGAEYLPSNFDISGLDRELGFGYMYTFNKIDSLYKEAYADDYLLPKFYHRGYKIYKNGEELEFSRGYSGLIETEIPVKDNEVIIERERSFLQNITFFITIVTSTIYGFIQLKRKKG